MKVVLEEASCQRCGRVEFLLLLLKSQRMTRKTKTETETMKRPVQSRSPRVPAGERERDDDDEISASSPASIASPPSLSLFSLSKIFTRLVGHQPQYLSHHNNGATAVEAASPFLLFSFWPSFQKPFEKQKLAATEQAFPHWRVNVTSLLPIRDQNTESQNNPSISIQTLLRWTLKEAAFSSAFVSTTTLVSLFFFFSDFGLPS